MKFAGKPESKLVTVSRRALNSAGSSTLSAPRFSTNWSSLRAKNRVNGARAAAYPGNSYLRRGNTKLTRYLLNYANNGVVTFTDRVR